MSKQGTLISVAQDQEGATPEIVTPDRPLPVEMSLNSDENPLNISDIDGQLRFQSASLELMRDVSLQLRILNKCMAIGHDIEITENDIEV